MSVRRLAEDHLQPAGFHFSDENARWAEATIQKYPEGRQQSAVIPLLMRAQEQDGWVTKAALESVADMLGMPYIRVLEVATFYTQFQLKPVGTRAHVQVCGTTPCMLRGSEALIEVCRRKINHEPFETNEGGTLSWEEVECQGACVNAPMVMIFKDTYEDLTPERLEEIIDQFEAGNGAEVPAGPQIDRIYSAPVGGLTTLNSADAGQASAPSNGKAPAKAQSQVPPSKAGRPVTTAAETDPSIDSPSPEKTVANEEVNSDGEEARRAEREGGRSDSVSGSATSSTTKGAGVGKARSKASASEAGTAKTPEHGAAGGQPPAMEKPDQPDDLQMIAGVGAKMEALLHEIGIWTWHQIANWSDAEQSWVDERLKLRGRIAREDWVRQATALAKGGEAEYVKVFGKLPR